MAFQPNVRALLELSGCTDLHLESKMMDILTCSPDPETAARHMLTVIPVNSPALENKWRKHIAQIWSATHTQAPLALDIPITSKEVAFAPILVEIHTLIQELHDHPADAFLKPKFHFLHPTEEVRIASQVPFFRNNPLHVRRICALAEDLRLIRPYKGKIRVVSSRYRAFSALPLPTQYYLLWHVDMYHLDWKEYFHEWGSHLIVFQQYLPMVWELLAHVQAGDSQSIDTLTARIVRSFRPMWQQGLAMGLYEQTVLQGMVESWLVDTVLDRYGFIEKESLRMFTWTSTAQAMLELERTTKLPCSIDVLS